MLATWVKTLYLNQIFYVKNGAYKDYVTVIFQKFLRVKQINK